MILFPNLKHDDGVYIYYFKLLRSTCQILYMGIYKSISLKGYMIYIIYQGWYKSLFFKGHMAVWKTIKWLECNNSMLIMYIGVINGICQGTDTCKK